MAVAIQHFAPLLGSEAVPIYQEGVLSFDPGSGSAHAPFDDMEAFVAVVEGWHAAIQVYRHGPVGGVIYGALSYVRPQFRRMGLFKRLREACDEDSLARGYGRVFSVVVDGPSAPAMCAAMEERGAVRCDPADFGRAAHMMIDGRQVALLGYVRELA